MNHFVKNARKQGNSKIINCKQCAKFIVNKSAENTALLAYQQNNELNSRGKKKVFLGGRVVENNLSFHPDKDDVKIASFQSMGQYDSSGRKQHNNIPNLIRRYKERSPKKQPMIVDKDEFTSGQGTLNNRDIVGSSPCKFTRGRKLFVDRNSIKTVLGQSPGK